MTPEWKTLAPLAAGIAEGLGLTADDLVLGEGDLSCLEHLIHEVAHAVSLGILPFGKGTDTKIGNLLEALKPKGGDVIEEEKAWAIEWFVWQAFSLDEKFEWGDLVAGAEIQGCDVDVIERLIDPEREESDEIYTFSEKVVAEVRRLTAVEAGVSGATCFTP